LNHFFAVKSGPHPCSVCKATVDQSRAVTHKSLAGLLGLRDDELGPDTRACNTCYAKVPILRISAEKLFGQIFILE
jgi:hypothetical protein